MAKRAAGIPIALRGIVIGPALGGVAVGFAAAAECPITSTSNRVEALLDAAPTCAAAADLFWACGLGGGRDVIRAEVVRQRCDRNAPKLNARELRAYEVALKRCWDGVEPLREGWEERCIAHRPRTARLRSTTRFWGLRAQGCPSRSAATSHPISTGYRPPCWTMIRTKQKRPLQALLPMRGGRKDL